MNKEKPTQPRTQTWKDQVPKPMSDACSVFLTDHWQVATFNAFLHLLAAEKDQHGAWPALMTRRDLLLQMVLCRAVDSYLCYITDLLALIFVNKPETLRSNEQLTYDEVLQHSDMKDVIGYIAEQRVLKLAYKGMRDLAADLSKRPGFNLFNDTADLDRAVKIIELRNLLTHNRGIINRLFSSHVPNYPGKLGERVELNMMDVFQDVDFIAGSVCDIEKRAAHKFGFPQPVSGEDHETKLDELTQLIDISVKAVRGTDDSKSAR